MCYDMFKRFLGGSGRRGGQTWKSKYASGLKSKNQLPRSYDLLRSYCTKWLNLPGPEDFTYFEISIQFSSSVKQSTTVYNKFEICVTVRHWYSIINSQLDASITNFIDNYKQLNMFRVIISPIRRSARLCLQFVVQCTGGAACR